LKVPAMVVNTIRIVVLPEKRDEFLQNIECLFKRTRGVTGCRALRFYVDSEDENSSLLFVEWETESDFQNYLQSNEFEILRGAIRVLSNNENDAKAFVMSECDGGHRIGTSKRGRTLTV